MIVSIWVNQGGLLHLPSVKKGIHSMKLVDSSKLVTSNKI